LACARASVRQRKDAEPVRNPTVVLRSTTYTLAGRSTRDTWTCWISPLTSAVRQTLARLRALVPRYAGLEALVRRTAIGPQAESAAFVWISRGHLVVPVQHARRDDVRARHRRAPLYPIPR
jgi:hypothetical protein